MTGEPWVFTQSDGELLVHTDVAGRAARLGHRLRIRMTTWQATVRWDAAVPVAVETHVDAAGLEIVEGIGGVKPLSGPEKIVARSNALGSLKVDEFPAIAFRAEDLTGTATGYEVSGELEIRGVGRPHVLHLVVHEDGDGWQLSFESPVVQSDFGVKPYSLMMGSLKVVDQVLVTWTARRSRQ